MPRLWDRLKAKDEAWARPWQLELQAELSRLERVHFGDDVFVAPEARLFAEPKREIHIGDGCRIAAEVFLHGPIVLGRHVSLNPRVVMEGGRKGIRVGDHTRVATGVRIFAFDHGIAPEAPVWTQPVRSLGVEIGEDCWLGAGVGVTDGVRIGDHAVVGMGAVVTRDVPDWAVVAGVPARVIGDRRDPKWRGLPP